MILALPMSVGFCIICAPKANIVDRSNGETVCILKDGLCTTGKRGCIHIQYDPRYRCSLVKQSSVKSPVDDDGDTDGTIRSCISIASLSSGSIMRTIVPLLFRGSRCSANKLPPSSAPAPNVSDATDDAKCGSAAGLRAPGPQYGRYMVDDPADIGDRGAAGGP